jgi:hypothetical protein
MGSIVSPPVGIGAGLGVDEDGFRDTYTSNTDAEGKRAPFAGKSLAHNDSTTQPTEVSKIF